LKLRPKTYGRLTLDRAKDRWVISETPPFVSLDLKNIFQGISKTQTADFTLDTSLHQSNRLAWFLQLYPLEITPADEKFLKQKKKDFRDKLMSVERIFMPTFKALDYPGLKDDCELWDYQAQFVEMFRVVKSMLLADDYGLGKTNQAIGAMLLPGMLPAAVVVEAHLPDQWKERIEEFSNLRAHIIKSTTPYELPVADVYIFSYSKLAGWSDVADGVEKNPDGTVKAKGKGPFKFVVYDEPQNLRTGETSEKGRAARKFTDNAEAILGLSATPVMNYGIEMWSVMSFIAPGVLGTIEEFEREWCVGDSQSRSVKDPDALGTYLRERQVLLRRTEDDINRAMPKPNVLPVSIPFDEDEARKSDELSVQLAIRMMTATNFVEKGAAARDLNIRERLRTGVAKARGVAAYTRMLLDAGIPVMLAGWHREVYDIWLEELKDYNPAMYTGSESKATKKKNAQAFINGETNLFIISNRSGAGLDGLQYRCRDVVHGELDWSPQILGQLRARLRRYGQDDVVNAHYMLCDGGSDPVMVDVLGVKASQAHGIMNPYMQPVAANNDSERMRRLAQTVLDRNGIDIAQYGNAKEAA
jgi:SNF2 family DNA or RNA helicase